MVIKQHRDERAVTFSAWTKTGALSQEFCSITLIDGEWYGRLGTEMIPKEVLSYFSETEQYAMRKAWRAEHEKLAYEAILASHPHAEPGVRRDGWITARYR